MSLPEIHGFEHRRPMMLKDYLRDESFHLRTTSFDAFPMYPGKNKAAVLLRSRSRRAAATTISAIHKVINVVKLLSISRKLPKKSGAGEGDASGVKVKVKDILRWRSFRDLAEDNSAALDVSSSPNRTATTTATSCSKRSSWCDSEFTAEEFPGDDEGFFGKKYLLGQPVASTKGNWWFEESEQQSPVSVLYSSFPEVEDSLSPVHPINLHRTKLINSARKVNEAEEKAKELLSHLKEEERYNKISQTNLLLDFFMDELSTNGKLVDEFDHSEILEVARSWIHGEYDGASYEWELEGKRKTYVKDMEKGVCWNKKFEQEQQEMSSELQVEVLDDLVQELLADLMIN